MKCSKKYSAETEIKKCKRKRALGWSIGLAVAGVSAAFVANPGIGASVLSGIAAKSQWLYGVLKKAFGYIAKGKLKDAVSGVKSATDGASDSQLVEGETLEKEGFFKKIADWIKGNKDTLEQVGQVLGLTEDDTEDAPPWAREMIRVAKPLAPLGGGVLAGPVAGIIAMQTGQTVEQVRAQAQAAHYSAPPFIDWIAEERALAHAPTAGKVESAVGSASNTKPMQLGGATEDVASLPVVQVGGGSMSWQQAAEAVGSAVQNPQVQSVLSAIGVSSGQVPKTSSAPTPSAPTPSASMAVDLQVAASGPPTSSSKPTSERRKRQKNKIHSVALPHGGKVLTKNGKAVAVVTGTRS